jgi:hypothetical protein
MLPQAGGSVPFSWLADILNTVSLGNVDQEGGKVPAAHVQHGQDVSAEQLGTVCACKGAVNSMQFSPTGGTAGPAHQQP